MSVPAASYHQCKKELTESTRKLAKSVSFGEEPQIRKDYEIEEKEFTEEGDAENIK